MADHRRISSETRSNFGHLEIAAFFAAFRDFFLGTPEECHEIPPDCERRRFQPTALRDRGVGRQVPCGRARRTSRWPTQWKTKARCLKPSTNTARRTEELHMIPRIAIPWTGTQQIDDNPGAFLERRLGYRPRERADFTLRSTSFTLRGGMKADSSASAERALATSGWLSNSTTKFAGATKLNAPSISSTT